MRLARAIASDISLYNEQKIIQGIEHDNLFETLRVALEQATKNLEQAQQRQAHFANQHRKEAEFAVGDKVFL